MHGSVEVTVARVDEIEPEPEEVDEPIQWVLVSTEPVEDIEDAIRVIEHYRARWKIEDWHRVLKSGCRIEDRQLGTWERMEVLLSIYSVVAWQVLELRELARGTHGLGPETFLSATERAVLEVKNPDLVGGSGRPYAIAVARVGGYLDRGSDPHQAGRRCGRASRRFGCSLWGTSSARRNSAQGSNPLSDPPVMVLDCFGRGRGP